MKQYKIEVVAYDPNWSLQYETEKKRLAEAITGIAATIEHIGGTSIPDIPSKPIIDISIGINDFSLADQVVKSLEPLGYRYEPAIENFIPECKFMWKGDQITDLFDVHYIHIGIRSVTGIDWRNTILFRDYLRCHPEAAKIYGEMKVLLATKHADTEDQSNYNHEKTTFVKTVLSLAQKSL